MSWIDPIRNLLGVSKAAAPPIPTASVPMPGTIAAPQKAAPFTELGQTGLLRMRGTGIVYDEWLPQLSGYRARQVYREMRDNDSTVGSMSFAVEMILRRAEWDMEAAKGAKGEEYAQFTRDCIDDMSHTWADFIAESTAMLTFGSALFETVYKKRQGPTGKATSKFDDGLIGWRKFAPRSMESILYWSWDEEGGLQGAVQLAAPDYKFTFLPIDKCLLLKTTSLKNNPEGRSVLRNAYRSYTYKKRLEEVEGIGLERDLCGLPVLKVTDEIRRQYGEANLRRMVTSVRVDDQMGLLLPLAYDENKNESVQFELLKASGGGKNSKIGDTIKRYEQAILSTMLAGFIQYGATEHGSRSLHLSATQIFAEALSAFLDGVASTINRYAIPRLMAMNGMDLSMAPKLVPGKIGVRDLEETGNFILKLAQAGIPLADPDTANHLRKLADLPEDPGDWMVDRDKPLDPEEDGPVVQPKPTGKPPATTPDDDADAEDRMESAA